jgi:hypothetical protein
MKSPKSPQSLWPFLTVVVISLLTMPLAAALSSSSQNEIASPSRAPNSAKKEKEVHSERALPNRIIIPLHEEPFQGLTPSEAAQRELRIIPSGTNKE